MEEDLHLSMRPFSRPAHAKVHLLFFRLNILTKMLFSVRAGNSIWRPPQLRLGKPIALAQHLGRRNQRPGATLLNFGWLSQKSHLMISMTTWNWLSNL